MTSSSLELAFNLAMLVVLSLISDFIREYREDRFEMAMPQGLLGDGFPGD
jgi:hypothetical protein